MFGLSMQLVSFRKDMHKGWSRREIRLGRTVLKRADAIQISQLTLGRDERYHTNRRGYVLCVVVDGWMEAHCARSDYRLVQGQGIIFEPGERHRINRGRGWMISISSLTYKNLSTHWERRMR